VRSPGLGGPESEGKSVVWFAGFAPYKNPRFAFAVMLEGKPHQGQSGGANAAPMMKEFLTKLFPSGQIPPALRVQHGIPRAIPVE
jgi:cell division protein FtsI/penicillin-binding protein 2